MSGENGNDMRYRLPHYGTPQSPSRRSLRMSGSPGTPDRPIFISDDSTAGTADAPIYVSDADVTDNESETDASNIAIRGTRQTVPRKVAVSNNRKSILERRNKALESLQQSRPKKTPMTVPNLEGRSKMISAKPALESDIEERPKVTSTKPVPQKQDSKVSTQETSTTKQNSKATTTTQPKKSSTIDIKALAKEEEDPILEQELEEIALNWRAGAISGTPSAHDVENGNDIDMSIFSFVDEDEADRSWHNSVSNLKPKTTRRQRMSLLLAVTGLFFGLTGCLIFVRMSNRPDRLVKEKEPTLTAKQQSIHDILARVTDSSILKNPNSPQYEARKWLLFSDETTLSSSGDDEATIIQRYVLACFYFATGGKDKWTDSSSSHWMAGNECGGDEPWSGLSCTSKGEIRAIVFGTCG